MICNGESLTKKSKIGMSIPLSSFIVDIIYHINYETYEILRKCYSNQDFSEYPNFKVKLTNKM